MPRGSARVVILFEIKVNCLNEERRGPSFYSPKCNEILRGVSWRNVKTGPGNFARKGKEKEKRRIFSSCTMLRHDACLVKGKIKF